MDRLINLLFLIMHLKNPSNKKLLPTLKSNLEQGQLVILLRQGLALIQEEKFIDAKNIFELILKKNPNQFDALQFLGGLLLKLNDSPKSVEFLSKALQVNPNHAASNSNLGIAYLNLNRLDEALLSFDKAIFIRPDYAEAYMNRGLVLENLGRFDEALNNFAKAKSIKKDYEAAYSNCGNVLKKMNLYTEACLNYQAAIRIKPNNSEVYSNLGNCLKEIGEFDEAILNYRKAININPHNADANFNLSLLNLLLGNFKDGWQGYEWGWKAGERSYRSSILTKPFWLGVEKINDKRILLYGEMGIGDVIQFCRYAIEIRKLGAEVILEVPRKLFALFQGFTGFDYLVEQGKPIPPYDYQCCLMSLPLAFKTELNTIPKYTKYLHVRTNLTYVIEHELKEKNKGKFPLVGISWLSKSKNGAYRSIELMQLIQKLDLKKVQYVNLQYGETSGEIAEVRAKLGMDIFQTSVDILNDTESFAALIEACDVIVTIDNSTVHLAGALGKDTRLVLPFVPEWRWLLNTEDSLWYPSVKLYRQNRLGDWDHALEKVRADLPFLS